MGDEIPTWERWSAQRVDTPLTSSGKTTVLWAIDALRWLLGETWMQDNAITSGRVPLVSPQWTPRNLRAIARVIELAVHVALVRREGGLAGVLQDARRIHRNPDDVEKEFNHLCLTLEVAAFAISNGWTAQYEKGLPSGRKPDLLLSRNGVDALVEVTVLSVDREFREVRAWVHRLANALMGLEISYGVELTRDAPRILDEAQTTKWLSDIEDACALTASDGSHRTARHGENVAEVYAQGARAKSYVNKGPALSGDQWLRVAKRLQRKVEQTKGGTPAWLRVDDIGTMFYLTDWSARPLVERLADIQHNIDIALADAPHVRGVILSGSDSVDVDPMPITQTAWPSTDPPGSPQRDRLAHGPVAMRRPLPGFRQRLTFVIPTQHRHVILPAGTGLEPGLWYDREPEWLDQTLQMLGHPPFAELVTS